MTSQKKLSVNAKTVNALNKRIHQLERMRQDFVANVSHELRTPLTVIHGYLETLLDQDVANIPQPKKIFEQMYQQSLRMERLVEDLLLLSRMDTGLNGDAEKLPKVAAPLIIKAIANDAKILSGERQHQIQLDIDESLTINGIESEIRSVFSNLIFNAIHYTPAEGQIRIKWFQENNQAYFEVSDTGIGIAPEHIPRLTERFYRVDPDRSRSTGGTGLGLAIVKHALLRHKGQLKIASEVGKGSTFTCVFPV